MCGRFVGFRNIEQLKQYLPIDVVRSEAVASFNFAPTQQILAIAQLEGLRVLDKYHWGLVPFWAKDKKIGYKMINARMETVASKPSFREAFKKRRCLIPADGFFEWQTQNGEKQPMFITLPDGAPFVFAGLWEIWHDKQNPEEKSYRSCTIITRESIGPVQELHNRMPVILDSLAYDPWLDPAMHDPDRLGEMLREHAITDLVFHPVSKQVNSVKCNNPSNIESI